MLTQILNALCVLLLLDPSISAQSAVYDEDGWRAASNFLLEAIDTSVDPCKNFYQFACGKWQKTYKGQFIGEPQKTIKFVADQLLRAIERIRDDPATPKYQKSLKTVFDQCVAATDEYDVALANIYNLTAELVGPMPLIDSSGVRRGNPYRLIGQMQRYTDTKILLETAVMPSQEKCETTAQLTLLPPFSHKSMLKLNASFTEKLVSLAASFGYSLNVERANERISELLEFEQNVSEIVQQYEARVYRLSELEQEVNGNISWEILFDGLMPARILDPWKKQNPRIAIYGVEYFRRLDSIIEELGYDKLLDYGYLRLFDAYMTDYMITPSLLQANVSALSTELQCIEYVLKYASAAAARVFFESIGSKPNPKTIWNWKHDLEMLAEAVFAASRYLIHTAEWLDVDDKAAIVEKVNTIRFASGIPQWILNDTAVLMHTPPYDASYSLFENDFRTYKQKFEWSLEPLLTGQSLPLSYKFDGSSYYLDPDPNFNWNAIYFEQTVELWMGLTLPPMYNYSYPLATKFGILGWIIGHELFHAFDHDRTSEREGVKRWIKPAAMKEFAKRVQCIVKQYSGYCYPEQNFCVSGDETLNDNIADLEGIKIAYMAYKFVTQGAGRERPLPGLESFTPDVLFFLSAARIWCGTGEDVEIYKHRGDVHAPGRARVELSMMNFPAFAQAFGCSTGSKFAPLYTCTLWGDFLEPNMDKNKKR